MKNKYRPKVFNPAEETEQENAQIQNVEEKETDTENTTYPVEETPLVEEEKIEENNGWKLITSDQHDGKHYLVTSDPSQEGAHAFWRRTRSLSHNKWVTHGKWSDQLTRSDILPQPIYYKEV